MNIRTGLRIHTSKVELEIGNAFKEFAKWIRRYYKFPVRFPVYLSKKKTVSGKDGRSSPSIFFAPFDNKNEPFLRIATGDYSDLVKELGKQNALLNMLYSLALGIVEYQKWLSDNSGLDSYDAEKDATELLHKYIESQKKLSRKQEGSC